ncbi:histone H2A deubiquitinase (DUF3755) [Rhynchospora pubera]|uniref:Histone H2A deubiquitinase (DUF3755) n=1 Tax=Rhynchospora pubera TaxID=906938 RepID=A0AAV8BVI5_9POAL|nr:histone H2A deubiquitinase (DUF3755) [Rhynchospora pubera]
MQMASEQNLNYGYFPQSFRNQNVVSFQNGMVNNTSLGMVPVSANESIEASSRVGGMPGVLNASCSMVVPMNNNTIGTSSMIGSSDMGNSSGLDQLHLKYGSSISVEWSQQELAILRDGLARHGNEQSILKYIKIAARLPEKTVRDVAMRCQWMMRRDSAKRRKAEEYYTRRKMKDAKDLAVESTLWAMNYPENVASPSFVGNNTKYSNQFSCGESEIDCAMRQVLEENHQLLSQIASNIEKSQTQSNIELFNRTHKNINIMLQSIIQMPGAMSNMPPLPVAPNEQLASYILPNVNLAKVPRINQLNEEPQGW